MCEEGSAGLSIWSELKELQGWIPPISEQMITSKIYGEH
jgi:hypothetical protein